MPSPSSQVETTPSPNAWTNFETGVTDYHPDGASNAWTADDFRPYVIQGGAFGDVVVHLFDLYVQAGDTPSDAYLKVMEAAVGYA